MTERSMDVDEFVELLLNPPEGYVPSAVAHDAGEDCDYSASYCVNCGDCKACFEGSECSEADAHVWSGQEPAGPYTEQETTQ